MREPDPAELSWVWHPVVALLAVAAPDWPQWGGPGRDDVLVALDAGTGEERWRGADPARALEVMEPRYGAGPHSTPLVTPGRLVVNGVAGTQLFRIERAGDGFRAERQWTTRQLGSKDHNMLLAGGRVVGSNSSATFSAVDVDSGRSTSREPSPTPAPWPWARTAWS